MPGPRRSIGETKLKILAIIHYNGSSHGYHIWTTLKQKYHSYLTPQSRRNVYHHLSDLTKLGLIERGLSHINKNAPQNHPYKLTDNGSQLETKYKAYLEILQ